MLTLPTTPMTLNDAIKYTFKLWWMMLFSVLPLSIAAGLSNSLPGFFMASQEKPHQALYFYIYIAAIVLTSFINIILAIAILSKLRPALHDQQISLSQSLAISIAKFPAILLFLIIFAGLMFFPGEILYFLPSHNHIFLIGLCIFFLIFFILFVYLICVIPLIIFENLAVIVAIRKSFLLTKGQWWYGGIFLAIIAFSIYIFKVSISLFIFGSIEIVMSSLGFFQFDPTSSTIIITLYTVIIYCFTLPLQMSMMLLFYEHLKLRHEHQS